MTRLDYARTLYYRHSGKTPVVRLLTALLTITPAVALAGAVYAIVATYLPMLSIDKLVLLAAAALMAGFAFGVGGLTGKMLLWARVRNLAMVWAVAIWAALFAWYVAWVVWEWQILRRWEYDPELLFMFTHPRGVWQVALAINDVGTVIMGHREDAIKGPILWILWAIEAGVVLGAATWVPYRMVRHLAFCEACQRWCRNREGILSVGPGDEERLRARLALKDLSALEELGPADLSASRRLRVDLQNCPACEQMHLLSVSRVEAHYKDGKRVEKAKLVVDRLWLDPEQARTVEEIKGRVYAVASDRSDAAVPVAPPAPLAEAVASDDVNDSELDGGNVDDEEVDEPSPAPETGRDPTRRTEGGMGL
jgi:hypothetical protein